MSEPSLKDILLIHKYLSSQISEQENELLNNWLVANPANREVFEEIKLIWENSDFSDPELDYDPEEELRKIFDRIDSSIANGPKMR